MNNLEHLKKIFTDVLSQVNIASGDALYMEISPLTLNYFTESVLSYNTLQFLHDCIFAIIGKQGTLITPTYSYSFCKNEIYDPQTSPCRVGSFGEWFRKLPSVHRSNDPIFSLAAQGPLAEKLFSELPNTCFGQDCVYERMANNGVKICNIGVSLHYTTALYHLLWRCGAPYRFEKLFTGLRRQDDGSLQKESWIYYVRALVDEVMPIFQPMHDLAVDNNVACVAQVGSSSIVTANLQNFYILCEKEFIKNPWCVTPQPEGCDILTLDKIRTGIQSFSVIPPKSLKAKDIIESVWNLPRDIVSDGYDAALQALAAAQPMKIHEYSTGEPAYTWIIPERWICRSAQLKKTDGTILYSTQDNPLCCMRYSLPFDGEVSQEELLQHLYSSDKNPESVPHIFKFYERNWGLCIPASLKQNLNDTTYHVHIDSDFSMGTLKVGEIILEGETDEHIVLCAHLCHPYQVSDGLSGVAVGMEVIERLAKLSKRRYTYHMLILPETIGSAAWCSHNETLLPKIKGGIFLEMLSSQGALVYKNSAQHDGYFDRIIGHTLRREYDSKSLPCYAPPLNDERMFNALGIPMMSLFRQEEGYSMFKNYHTSDDNFENCDEDCLEEACNSVYSSLLALEHNYIPIPQYKGELFCSRINGLDYSVHSLALIQTTFFMDGKNALSDIAQNGDFPFSKIYKLCEVLFEKGLIKKLQLN
jgi:aminopeptidase-like protein/aminoglycoside N3'-acetyltransferase